MNNKEIAQRCRDTMWHYDTAVREMGIEVSVSGPGMATTTIDVKAQMVNGHGICHGGFIFTLADSAFAYACNTYDRVTVAASAGIEFVRPARLGDRLTAEAREAHRGGRTGIYDVEVTNEAGEVVAIFRGRSYATRQPIVKSDT
ncbi:MAG: hydroxyphenylacetyl-CoA thioesterase PaaI [Pseudomonadota bacterium]|nr:hydroxyphenylacetyl-CoA thioesterase PaaI [Pseudomonadota bacterium]